MHTEIAAAAAVQPIPPTPAITLQDQADWEESLRDSTKDILMQKFGIFEPRLTASEQRDIQIEARRLKNQRRNIAKSHRRRERQHIQYAIQ